MVLELSWIRDTLLISENCLVGCRKPPSLTPTLGLIHRCRPVGFWSPIQHGGRATQGLRWSHPERLKGLNGKEMVLLLCLFVLVSMVAQMFSTPLSLRVQLLIARILAIHGSYTSALKQPSSTAWSNFLNHHVFTRGEKKNLKQTRYTGRLGDGIRSLGCPALCFWPTERIVENNWRTYILASLCIFKVSLLIPISSPAQLSWLHVTTSNPWGESKSLGWLGLQVGGENVCALHPLSVTSTVDARRAAPVPGPHPPGKRPAY